MKKTAIISLIIIVSALQSCKKSSTTAPSIVGSWVISDISGEYTTQSSPSAPLSATAYSYTGGILIEADTTHQTLIDVNEEQWQFNSDGTFVINENFQINTANTPTVHVMNGWWDYTGSTIPNSTIVLRGSGTPNITPTGGAFLIQSVTSTKLILLVKESTTSTTGSTTIIDIGLTFTRQ